VKEKLYATSILGLNKGYTLHLDGVYSL